MILPENIVFTHADMGCSHVLDFTKTPNLGLSVGILKYVNGRIDLITDGEQLLSSCSAIIFINNTARTVALYHYPANNLKTGSDDPGQDSRTVIRGLLETVHPDEIYIYTGYERGCKKESFVRDQSSIIEALNSFGKERNMLYSVRSCFVTSGTAFVCCNGPEIITGTSGHMGKLYSYCDMPESGCDDIENETRASLKL